MEQYATDYLVIGGGLAGLLAALELAPHGRVLLATKNMPSESNSAWAQGGIACAVAAEDSIEEHVQDTLSTGRGLCDESAVRAILGDAQGAIIQLERYGVVFSRQDHGHGDYDLGREGGHTRRRVLHAGDITGREMIRVLHERVQADPRIDLRQGWHAIDLVTTGWLRRRGPNRCVGAYFLDRSSGDVLAVQARDVILATGGAGKVYLYTSNPDGATGDGLAMAWRAGLPILNLEFVQFHPTCLYHPAAKSFLISEAVRGEGAVLIGADGVPFMERYDPRGSLAPRDVVARAIDSEIKRTGQECVYLDLSARDPDFIRGRFPNIHATCLRFGVDMTREPIPVVPAAHYFCGGVAADVNGSTCLPGLSVIGESACTGLHGANRLASNSLLEAAVCALRSARRLTTPSSPSGISSISIPAWQIGCAVPSDEEVVVEHNWDELRRCMWDYVGIVRSRKRMERAARRIRNLRREIREYYQSYLVTADVLELRNIAAVAELIIRSAMGRQESRGLHFTLDAPEPAAGTPWPTRVQDMPGGLSEWGGLA